MAVTANKYSVSLKVVFNYGINPETNKQITKVKTFNNIKASATDENLYKGITTIAPFLEHSIKSIRKVETYELYEE